MPAKKRFHKKKRTTVKRRLYRKKRTTYNAYNKPVYFKGASLVPDRAIVKMQYFKRHSQTGITTAPYEEIFNLGGIFNINGGAQPRGHDQYASLYHRYRVIKVQWKAHVATTTANGDGITGAYMLDNVQSVFGDLRDIMEYRRSFSSRIITNEKPTTIKGYAYPWIAMNISKREYMTDDQYAALFGASPLNQGKIVFWGQSNDEASSTAIVWDISFTYTVLLDQPVAVAPS